MIRTEWTADKWRTGFSTGSLCKYRGEDVSTFVKCGAYCA